MPGGSTAIILWVLIFVGIFYFLAIRPQRRQKQQHDELLRMIKKGDEIVTIGGMMGTVTRIGDDWLEVEVAKRTRVRLMKYAIRSITTISEDDEEDEELIEVEEDEFVEGDEIEEPEAEEPEEDIADDQDEVEVAEEDEGEAPPSAPSAPPVPGV
ncbi:MAG: preprotein translocase subunit YajC [Thermoleophilia bacterium]